MIISPDLLDLCSGAGLAADGYAAVGFRPHGVDIEPQPSYPYPFAKANAVDVLESDEPEVYPVLHVSWPCQEHTTAGHLRTAQGGRSKYGDLLTPGLEIMRRRWGHKVWIAENVKDRSGKVAAIMAPRAGEHLVYLCGSMFGLDVQRHRLFLSNVPLRQPRCDHSRFPIGPSGRPKPVGVYHVPGDRIPSGGHTARDAEHGRQVMGSRRLLPWDELKEGFPPAYTSHVGADVLVALALRSR